MNIQKIVHRLATGFASFILVIPLLASVPIASATASPTTGAPGQSSCDTGMGSQSWNVLNHGEAVVRPTVSSASIKADSESVSETITSPENPSVGDLGISICANVAMGRRTGLFVYTNTDAGGDFDLSHGETPTSHVPITSNSEITITIEAGDMGELAPYYSFSLIHGFVTNWVTSELGTENAALSVTLKPVRTPYGSGPDFEYCTATPPVCFVDKSDVDALSASMDMTFTTSNEGTDDEVYDIDGNYSEMRGAYVAMKGAMGGWAQAEGPGGQPRRIITTLGGPEHLANGIDANFGSMQAYLTDDIIANLFQTTTENLLSSNALDVARTDSVDNADEISIDAAEGGIIVSIDNFHFSSPTYSIGIEGFNSDGGGTGGPEDSDTSKTIDIAGGFANLSTGEGTVISSFTNVSEQSLSIADPAYDYPHGLFNFKVAVPSGSKQTVQLALVTDLKPSQFTLRKYNAVTKTFSTITDTKIEEDMFNGKHVLFISYDITDGGTLDQDGTVNGEIVDPVGLGTSVVVAPNTGFGNSSIY